MLFLPFPDFLDEFLTPEIVSMSDDALLLERALDHRLGGDPGVVGAGKPEDFLAVHPCLASEDVLDGIVEYVTHVKHAGDVGRRDDHGISRAPLGHSRRISDKNILVEPELIPLFFDRRGCSFKFQT